jgi:Holliday junction resolvase-like predicted endonuclease
MNRQEIKRRVDSAAKVYLEMRGFNVLEQNWRIPGHEIRVIAQKGDVIYFVYVSYSSNDSSKPEEANLSQHISGMEIAAQVWLEENKSVNRFNYSYLEIYGNSFQPMVFIDKL